MRSESLRRVVLAGGALLVLLVVVALATRGNLGGSEGGPGPGSGFVDYVFTVFLAVFVLLIPLSIWMYWQQRAALVFEAGQRRGRRHGNVLTVVFLVALAGWIQYLRTHHRGPFGSRNEAPKPNIPQVGKLGKDGGAEPLFHWWLFALIVALAATGLVAALVVARRRKRSGPPGAQSLGQAVSVALDEALDDLRAGDPRAAVIAAYGRLELVLGFHGLPREPYEAPFEWLSRILVGLHASAGSAERLAALFERARFSRHTIDEAMREEAIAALVDVRDELRATT